jgi:hypothetical protein
MPRCPVLADTFAVLSSPRATVIDKINFFKAPTSILKALRRAGAESATSWVRHLHAAVASILKELLHTVLEAQGSSTNEAPGCSELAAGLDPMDQRRKHHYYKG